jgi:proline iminopeptidase
MTVREQLYELVDAFDTGFLKVSDIHTLHYEQAGNPVSLISRLIF